MGKKFFQLYFHLKFYGGVYGFSRIIYITLLRIMTFNVPDSNFHGTAPSYQPYGYQ